MSTTQYTRILFVSDLHYTPYHNEEDQGEWLLGRIDEVRPDVLISAGDWDELATAEYLSTITQKVPLFTIYGNHENMLALQTVKNPLLRGMDILLPDYRIVDLSREFGFKIVGVSGIWSGRRSLRRGVPRKKGDKFIVYAREFYEKYHPERFDIDILLIHDVPNIPEYSRMITMHAGTVQIREMIELFKPKLVLNGHVHLSEYTFAMLDYGGYYLRVDSSKKHRGFAVIYWNNNPRIEVYKESVKNKIFEVDLEFENAGTEIGK